MASNSSRVPVVIRLAALVAIILAVTLLLRSCDHGGKTTTTTVRAIATTSSPHIKFAPQPTLPSGRVFTITPSSSATSQPTSAPAPTVAPVVVTVDPKLVAAVSAFVLAYSNYRYDQAANASVARLTGCNCVTTEFLSAYMPIAAAANDPAQSAKNTTSQLVVATIAPASTDITATVTGNSAVVRVAFGEHVSQIGTPDNARYLVYQLQLTSVNGWRVSAIPQAG